MIALGDKDISNLMLGNTQVTKVMLGEEQVWPSAPSEYQGLTIIANEDSTISLKKKGYYHTVEYSIDGKEWINLYTKTISLLKDEKLYIRGVLSRDNSNSDYTQFAINGNVSLAGNINYIWNYKNITAPLRPYCGYNLFKACTGITDISQLKFPSVELANYCYGYTFSDCTSLTRAHIILNTTLASNCYYRMFGDCSSLIDVPELPATEVIDNCYCRMFINCTSLIEAPVLPAKILKESCYYEMFKGCSELNYVKCLGSHLNFTNSNTYYWLSGVATGGTFIKLKDDAGIGLGRGTSGIPTSWEIIEVEE